MASAVLYHQGVDLEAPPPQNGRNDPIETLEASHGDASRDWGVPLYCSRFLDPFTIARLSTDRKMAGSGLARLSPYMAMQSRDFHAFVLEQL